MTTLWIGGEDVDGIVVARVLSRLQPGQQITISKPEDSLSAEYPWEVQLATRNKEAKLATFEGTRAATLESGFIALDRMLENGGGL